jgi:hypothetical protein
MSAMLAAALAYARLGLAVFPARPDKKCSYKSLWNTRSQGKPRWPVPRPFRLVMTRVSVMCLLWPSSSC